jgi:hypothetical protein
MMDFRYSEDQQSVRDLARQIFTAEVSEASLKAVEQGGPWLHRPLWEALAQAELLGVAIPAEFGGAGMGLTELCLLLEQQGSTVAPAPLMPTLALGASAIARFGSAEQKSSLLRSVASGDLILSAALSERTSPDPMRPATVAIPDGDGWTLTGEKTAVAVTDLAEWVLVPASLEGGGVGVFLVEPGREGVALKAQRTTTGEPLALMELEGVCVEKTALLGTREQGEAVLRWLVQHAMIGLCAIQVGVSKRQLSMLAEYATERQQFGQPIGAFQAVSQRAADAYIDVECLRVSYLQALWRLSEGLECQREILIARFWAAEAGHRVAAAAQHIHGAMGVDCDYPLHRYTLLTRSLEFTLGGANQTLGRLGGLVASSDYCTG